jgi:hypothetical protein
VYVCQHYYPSEEEAAGTEEASMPMVWRAQLASDPQRQEGSGLPGSPSMGDTQEEWKEDEDMMYTGLAECPEKQLPALPFLNLTIKISLV